MSPITHLLAGWAVANVFPLERRERAVITLAGVAPDLDGLGIVAEILTRNSAHPLNWWTEYHHVFGHNLLFCFIAGMAAFAFARQRRLLCAVLAMVSAQLHLVCDLAGARGPDGTWAIPYLWPFSQAWTWDWAGQWKLNSWQNLVITAGLLGLMFRWAVQRGCSPLELISARANKVFVQTLRARMKRDFK